MVRISGVTLDLFESLALGAPSDYIFKGQRLGAHLIRQAIAFSMRKCGKLADLELHPHRLQHSHAMYVVTRGFDIFTLHMTL